jgi:hypothetical protein
MSNALAIAAVTESLVNLLTSGIDAAQVNNASVSNFTPDQLDKVANPGINVFLYQVTPNVAKRNADLPTRAAGGTFLQKPQAALDLHYLLTFYGDDTFLQQQRLMGAAALTLHVNPTLPRSAILPVQLSPTTSAPSYLDKQSELIRFTPVVFSLEELSKLWSFLLKIDYVLSAAYLASVVLIEHDETIPPTLPVLSYNVQAQAIRQPIIAQIIASPNPSAPINAGRDIALIGTNLAAPTGGATQVLINGTAQLPSVITPTRITLTLPPGLSAGPQTAQVLQPVVIGTPPVSHPGTGAASGVAAFVLNPYIAPGSPPGTYEITVLHHEGSPPGPGVAVTVVPTVQTGQHAFLQLIPQSGMAPGLLFDGGTVTAPTDTLIFSTPNLPSDTYIVSVLIDGAQSPVTTGPGGPPPIITV